jgi:predicted nucleic acid-binding protein
VRAVLDPNVLIPAVLSRTGAPAQLLARWLAGGFELVVSPALLEELARALAYLRRSRELASASKPHSVLSKRIAPADAAAYVSLLRERAEIVADPPDRPSRSADPGDDYLIALAATQHAVLVSGDRHLLELAAELPVLSARAFLERLES